MPRVERRLALAALALIAAVLALYWPVHAFAFVSYDDEVYVSHNPRIAGGLDWRELGWFFTHAHAANYHPLTWLAHMLDVELFGLDPGPHHLVNVALHALNAILALFLARALLGDLWAALATAALFALHPLRVESVAWVSERKDLLCAFFYLAALLAWLHHARAPSAGRYALVLVLVLLALLAKPMAVTLPCALFLLDFWPLARLEAARPWRARAPATRTRLVLEKLPFFALAALGAVTTWYAQEVEGAASGWTEVPLDLRLLNALAALGTYLRQSLWPAELACFYPLAAIVAAEPHATLLGPALGTLAFLAGLTLLAWRLRARAPWFLAGWLWFFGLLVPVIGLKQVGMQAHADRYTYLPLLGPAWILCGAARALARRRVALAPALLGTLLVALALLAARTRAQLATWRDTSSLFRQALAVTERNYVAHAALGNELLERGEFEQGRRELAAALAIYPLETTALTGLARLELDAGNPKEAEALLVRAKQVHASKWVRYQMGRTKLALGNPEAAAREFRAALLLDPSLVDAHFNLGQVLFHLGRKEEARASFEHALALDRGHAGAENGLGALALAAGALEAAEQHFARALELDPEYADARHNLELVRGRRAEPRKPRRRGGRGAGDRRGRSRRGSSRLSSSPLRVLRASAVGLVGPCFA
jgi:tetratricopeptide (TPR) repeat protein